LLSISKAHAWKAKRMDAELKDLYISDLQFPVKNFVLCQQQKALPKRKGPFSK
jgi:hypothetical protein